MTHVAGTGIRGAASSVLTTDIFVQNDLAAAFVRGRAYVLDLADAGANIPTETVFSAGSLTADPTVHVNGVAVGTAGGIWVVALDTTADQTQGSVRIQGIVEGLLDSSGCSQGDDLSIDSSGDFTATVTASDTIKAWAMEDVAASSVGTILFSGMFSFHVA